jgi:hypothetical protein
VRTESVVLEVKMIVTMDMSSGRRIDEKEFGPFEDEVLCANWMRLPMPRMELQEVVPEMRRRPARREPPRDMEAFLRAVYLNQE